MIDRVLNSPREWTVSPQKLKFAAKIRVIVSQLESMRGKSHPILSLIRQHQVKRRRLYDVTNVFTAIGCAARCGVDDIRWEGVGRILPHLRQEKERLNVGNYKIPLADLFPLDTCVCLRSLTLSFILLFAALGRDAISLRDASAFFSRETQRYKTTLSKLYQITLILSAVDMTERADNPSEVRLRPPFSEIIAQEACENPLAIKT
jgi:hypothetical protein